MHHLRTAFDESGLSLDELGQRMGYPKESARKSAWQFFRSTDPRLSMIEKCAVALGLDVQIVESTGKKKRGK